MAKLEGFQISLKNYNDTYPLLVFDISRQTERLKDTGSDMRIKADFILKTQLHISNII